MASVTGQGGSLVKRAMDAVNDHIRANGLRVGDSLPGEAHFAAEMGVSRAVMREAFGALGALRLIDVANGRRPRVGAIDGSVIAASLDHAVSTAQIGVAEIWDVRRTIEVRTAALAALNRTDEQAARIVELAEIMSTETGDMVRTAQLDIEFHNLIARAGGNALFVQIVGSFGPLMEIAVPAAWRTRTTNVQRQIVISHHMMLARAIADQDETAAIDAMEAHFDTSVGDVLKSGVYS